MNRCCGIDFGTSNSSIGVVDSAVRLIKVEEDYITIPSTLFFPNIRSSQTIFGRAARHAYILGEEGRFMRSLKRVLGTSLMRQRTQVNSELMTFHDIIARFIRNMKLKAEAEGNGDIDNVVMGRPVHFVDYDHAADGRAESELREIARLTGFKNIEFQFEPIAAAFAHEQNLKGEKLSLVVDIGGGTSDFTVIRLSPMRKNAADRSSDILANTGVRIGGNDFDKDLSIKTVMPEFGYESIYGEKKLAVPRSYFHDISEWSKVNFVYTPRNIKEFSDMLKVSADKQRLHRFVNILERQLGHHFLDSIENAKIDLTLNDSCKIDFDYIDTGFLLDVTKNNLDNSINDNVEKVMASAKECLAEARIKASDIELIILTGGSTEIPYVQQVLSTIFPNAELSQENKLSSVALGLTYDAKRKFA